MKLPRKSFEYVDSALITQNPKKINLEFYLSLISVCLLLTSFVLWNSPGWMYYANIPYLQLVLITVLIVFSMNLIWIVLAFERYFIKKTRIKKYNIEFIASFVTIPFLLFVVSVLVDFITNFRTISDDLIILTAFSITFAMVLFSLWCAFSLERWMVLRRKESGEEEDEIWVEEWVDKFADEEEDIDEEEYIKEDIEEIDYST